MRFWKYNLKKRSLIELDSLNVRVIMVISSFIIPAEQFYSSVSLFSPCLQYRLKRPNRPSLMYLQCLTGWEQECRSASLHPSTCTAECSHCSSTVMKRHQKAKSHGGRTNLNTKCLFSSAVCSVNKLAYRSDSLPGNLGHNKVL